MGLSVPGVRGRQRRPSSAVSALYRGGTELVGDSNALTQGDGDPDGETTHGIPLHELR